MKTCDRCGTYASSLYPVVDKVGKVHMVGSSCVKHYKRAKRSDLFRSLYKAAIPFGSGAMPPRMTLEDFGKRFSVDVITKYFIAKDNVLELYNWKGRGVIVYRSDTDPSIIYIIFHDPYSSKTFDAYLVEYKSTPLGQIISLTPQDTPVSSKQSIDWVDEFPKWDPIAEHSIPITSTSKSIVKYTGRKIKLPTSVKHRDFSHQALSLDADSSVIEASSFASSVITKSNIFDCQLISCTMTKAIINESDITSTVIYECFGEHLTISKSNIDHTDFRKQNSEISSFSFSVFNVVNIRDSILNMLNVFEMSFISCLFESSELKQTYFQKSKIENAKFYECNIEGSLFENSKLSSVFFPVCNMTRISLMNCHFTDCIFGNKTNLSYSKIRNTIFKDTQFRGADLTGSTMKNVSFIGGTDFHNDWIIDSSEIVRRKP